MVRIFILFLACALLVASAVSTFVQERFLSRASISHARVENITASNGRCSKSGGKRRARSQYDCTKFQASLEFTTSAGSVIQFTRSAGKSRGHNQDAQSASYRLNDTFKVFYDPDSPSSCVLDTWWEKWGLSFALFLFGTVLFLCGLLPSRKQVKW